MKFLKVLVVASLLVPTVSYAQPSQPTQQDLQAFVNSLTPQQRQQLRTALSSQTGGGGGGGGIVPTNFAFPLGSALLSLLALSGNNNSPPPPAPGTAVSTTP